MYIHRAQFAIHFDQCGILTAIHYFPMCQDSRTAFAKLNRRMSDLTKAFQLFTNIQFVLHSVARVTMNHFNGVLCGTRCNLTCS